MSKVSICSSVYNQADLLKGMIASVIGQSYQDWELIVVDDASTDDIKSVCEDWNDPRVIYERLPENRGVTYGMNHAISLATGKYIGFLSADERIDLNKLLWQVGYLDDHPAIGGIWGLPQNGPLGERPEWEQYHLKAHNRSREAWIRTLLNLENIPIGGASWLTYKSVIDDIGGFDHTMGKCSDLELFVRFFQHYEGRIFPYRWAWEDEANRDQKPQVSAAEFQGYLQNVRNKHPLELPISEGTITIAIPIRDMAHLLPHTLASIKAQTYTDYKIVVFDDQSSDDLTPALEGYDVEFIKSADNVGCNAAQNHMLAQCKTPFFVVLAADDTLEPTYLERCIAQFKANPWVEFVASQTDFIDKDGKPFTGEHPFKQIGKAVNKQREIWLQQLYYGNVYFGCGMYRTKVLQDIGGWDSTVGVIADYDVYLKLLQRENIQIIHENLTHTRIHDKNRSIGRDRQWGLKLREDYHTCHLRYWAPRQKVIIATPFYEMKAYSPYVESLAQTIQMLMRLNIEYEWLQLAGDSYVDRAKNTILNKVLEDPDCTDVFMIDSDMQWNPMSVYYMLQLPEEIVMGSYPQKNMWETWTSVPVIQEHEGRQCPIGRELPDGSALLQAQWLSGGFMRIKRSALVAYRDKYPDLRYVDPGADPGAPDREYVEFFTCERAQLNGEGPMLRWGEDRVFGKRMKELGIDGWIYPNVDFGHYGVKGWMGNYDHHMRGLKAQSDAKGAIAVTTASDIITSAARALGYLGRTESLSAGDANDGLTCFNRLLDSWSNEFLMSYVLLQSSFSLISMQQSYTIGSGGYVNIPRPYDIISAFVRDANNLDYGMNVIPRQQWDDIGLKTITSQIPTTLFYSSAFPLGTIYIFPIPLLNYTVFFNSTTDQVDYSTLVMPLSLPIGYERAYVFNLALDMQSMGFPCLLNDRDYARLVENAAQAKGNIKRANIKEVEAEYDPAVVSKSYATYNVYSDGLPRN